MIYSFYNPVSVPRWNCFNGDENFYQNPNGDRKSIVFISKRPVGIVLECNFFPLISNGDKIIEQFPSWDEILGFFPPETIYSPIFFNGLGLPKPLRDNKFSKCIKTSRIHLVFTPRWSHSNVNRFLTSLFVTSKKWKPNVNLRALFLTLGFRFFDVTKSDIKNLLTLEWLHLGWIQGIQGEYDSFSCEILTLFWLYNFLLR